MTLDSGRPPADPPYRPPSGADSRQSSRAPWYSPRPSASSPQSHVRTESSGHARGDSKDHAQDDKAATMDPRRFTPNLHASLVSEILSLRREIEGKNTILTTLEESLHKSRVENGQSEATITSQDREIRSVKKQMQLLESGTLSALGDLAKERDGAMANLAEVRKRLEASKSNVRALEEDAKRNQSMWDQDKRNWGDEKRNMERKVHVAEGRLKTMVNEVAAVQASSQLASAAGSDNEEGIGDTWFSNWSDIVSTRSSSARGRYHLSELSHNTYDTNELANLTNGASMNGTEPNIMSLAEELNFEGKADDHGIGHVLDLEATSPGALPEENPCRPRSLSVQNQDGKARRILGLPNAAAEQSCSKEALPEHDSSALREEPVLPLHIATPRAQDAGTQFSPPSSPKSASPEFDAIAEKDTYRSMGNENSANQRRKRVSIAAASHDSFPSKSEPISRPSTASAACQTVLQPTSPLLVPMIALEPMFPDPSTILSPEMISSSTQTDAENPSASRSAGTQHGSSPNAIPVIAIHPPNSRPGTAYDGVVLPPRTKNASCQTKIPTSANLTSTAVQTEGIQVDKRAVKIPPRLMSAAASSKPHSRNGQHARGLPSKTRRPDLRSPFAVEPSHARTVEDPHLAKLRNRFGGTGQPSRPTSPANPDNPFAGFSDHEASGREIDLSDDDDDFANVAPIRKTLSKVQNSWKLVPASMAASLGPRPLGRPISDIQEIDDTSELVSTDLQSNAARKQDVLTVRPLGHGGTPNNPMNASQRSDMRKAALFSNGSLAHTRKRSPSEPGPAKASGAVPPPFPVPTRSSSRRKPISSSEGNGCPTPYTTTSFAAMHSQATGSPATKNALRKVRSAAAVSKFVRSNVRLDEADSPPVTSRASTPLGSPGLPRFLRSESTPQQSSALARRLEQEASSLSLNPSEAPMDSPGQTISVVDAIAQGMVGEWMWKYVRKRRSFGMPEKAQAEFEEGRNNTGNSSGIRHKRWVWLAPHERTVMWSSKQPTNGSALLGKGGRKLTIQSVVDVLDDTPMPKNAGIRSNFGHSILILTPQRALKFTAPNPERHRIWLTALSYLGRSTLGMEDLTAIPPVPQAEYQRPTTRASRARRSPRDSIRLAKSKERPSLQARNYTAPISTVAEVANTRDVGYDGADDSLSDAAEAPQIPRVSHARKSSNTGPRRFNSFPANIGSSSSHVTKKTTPREIAISVTRGFQGSSSGLSAMRRHVSETTIAQPEAVRNDFFDALGTMRMEAFVDRRQQEPADSGKEKPPPRSSYRSRQVGKKDLRYWGIMGEASSQSVPARHGSKSASASAWRVDDPFKGF
ncbi:MAG: hypothetical protein LQ344_005025 [Seirophora lacunosa]|nr:MAG: hypothetical protein LQ344_005025 [Seirophora lacunosa]